MSSKQIAGKPERYYVKNGVLFANSDYEPQRVVADSTNDLIAVQDKLEPGAIGHVTGTDVDFELSINNTWVGQSGVPMVKPEDPDTITDQVIFIDYDGSVVVSYTKDLFMEMTEMPPNPKHEGLISQGWNWDLDRIKYYLEKYPDCVMTIGQMYCTADGATHIHLNVQGRLTVPLMFQQGVENGVTLDWGDGSDPETVADTGVVTTNHTYAAEGEYILKMKATDGCEMNFGGTIDEVDYNIFGETSDTTTNLVSSKYCDYITELYFSNNIVEILNASFSECSYRLQYVIIPKSIISLGNYAFKGCYCVNSIIIPNNATHIGSYAFLGCTHMKYLSLSESLTDIGSQSFYNCNILKTITIPEDITTISSYAFTNCYMLQNITISKNVASINSTAFYCCTRLKKLVLPIGISTIGSNSFSNCFSLEYLIMPDEANISFQNGAFYICNLLKNIKIPRGVTNIRQMLFANCLCVKELYIPSSVEVIGATAFTNCYSMLKIIIEAETPPTLANVNAFTNLPSDCIIYVPYSEDHSILEAYQTATNWSTWANQMVESEPDESEGTDDSMEPEEEEATNNG